MTFLLCLSLSCHRMWTPEHRKDHFLRKVTVSPAEAAHWPHWLWVSVQEDPWFLNGEELMRQHFPGDTFSQPLSLSSLPLLQWLSRLLRSFKIKLYWFQIVLPMSLCCCIADRYGHPVELGWRELTLSAAFEVVFYSIRLCRAVVLGSCSHLFLNLLSLEICWRCFFKHHFDFEH